MKVSGLKVNVEALEQGAWVDNIPEMEGLRLKVRGIGNKDWRKLQARLFDSVPRKKRIGGRLDPDEQDRITTTCLRECGLVDWDGLENEDGSALPYSKEMAGKLLADPEMAKFRDGVLWACSIVADQDAEYVKDAAKN